MTKSKPCTAVILFLLLSMSCVAVFAGDDEYPNDFKVTVTAAQLNCEGGNAVLSLMMDGSRLPSTGARDLKTELIIVRVDDGSVKRLVLSITAPPGAASIVYPGANGFSSAVEKNNVVNISGIQLGFPPSDNNKWVYSLIVRTYGLAKNTEFHDDKYFQLNVIPACLELPAKLPEPDPAAKGETVPPPNVFPFKDVRELVEKFKPTKDDNASNIKVDYSYDGSRSGLKDAKIGLLTANFQPKSRELLRGHGAVAWRPVYFGIKYSSKKSEPIRSLEIGSSATHYWMFRDDGSGGAEMSRPSGLGRVFTGIETKVTLKSESDFTFGKWNFTGTFQQGLPMKWTPLRFVGFRLMPFAGIEYGRVLNRPDDTELLSKERTILRPFFGAELRLMPFKIGSTRMFEVTANYKNLIIAKPEIRYRFNAITGAKEAEDRTTAPQFFVTSKLTLLPETKFSPFVEFSYGREPVEFILVNRRWRVGIAFNWDYSKKD